MTTSPIRHLFLALACVTMAHAQQPSVQTKPLPSLSETVVVLGSPDPLTEAESSRAVTVLDIAQHPLALQSAIDPLRSDPSVDIQQRGAAGTQSDVSIRGTSFEQTLVLLNGLRINDAETSHFNLDLPVPLDAISSIDVLHGSGSTLYGSDAIGGVIDVITADPISSDLHLRTALGTSAGSRGNLADAQAFTGALVGRRWSEVLAAARDRSTGFIPDRDFRSENASSETRLRTSLGHTDILLAGSDRPFGADQFYGSYNSFERTKGWFASALQQFDEHTAAALAFRRHSDLFVLFRDRPGVYKNQHIDQSWQAAIRRNQPLTHLANVFYGVEEDTDQIVSNSLGRHGRNRTAGYLSLDLRARQRGTLSLGIREELLSGGRVVSSPSVSGSLRLAPTVKLRASSGYGFRLPTYVDLYYSDPATAGNANLKPESAWNFDGGADWYPSSHTEASATVFYSRQQNAIDYVRPSSLAKWQASNLVGLRYTGVETSLTLRPGVTQQLRLGWTLLFGAQNALNGLQSEYVFNYPTNKATAEYTATAGRQQLLFNTRLDIIQRYQQTAYAVLGASVARERGHVHPFLQLTNLANTGYAEILGIRMPGRGISAGVDIALRSREP